MPDPAYAITSPSAEFVAAHPIPLFDGQFAAGGYGPRGLAKECFFFYVTRRGGDPIRGVHPTHGNPSVMGKSVWMTVVDLSGCGVNADTDYSLLLCVRAGPHRWTPVACHDRVRFRLFGQRTVLKPERLDIIHPPGGSGPHDRYAFTPYGPFDEGERVTDCILSTADPAYSQRADYVTQGVRLWTGYYSYVSAPVDTPTTLDVSSAQSSARAERLRFR